MKHRTTIKLAVAVLLTGCFIWILEMTTSTVNRARGRPAGLLSIEPERMNYLSFYRDGAFVECVNERGQWFINRPVRDHADDSAIHRILAIVESLPRKEVISAAEMNTRGLTPEQYGLAKPRAWLVLGNPDERRKLMIGNLSPLNDTVYVRLNNEQDIIATATNVLRAVPAGMDDIRDMQLLRGSPSYVTRLEIKCRNKPMLSLQREGSEWIIQKPVVARADWVKVSRLLDCLFSARILKHVSETMTDPVAYGLGEDEAVLMIGLWHNGQPEGENLACGKAADERGESVYANRRGSASIFAINAGLVEDVETMAGQLRDSRLYFMAADKVNFISIEESAGALSMRKHEDGAWEIIKPQQWAADGRVVSDLVNRLNVLKITAFIDASATNLVALGLDSPARVIRMADRAPEPGSAAPGVEQLPGPIARKERTLKLSGVLPGRESVIALFDDDPQVYEVSAASVMTLSIDPLKYRDPITLALDPSSVRSITLNKNGSEEAVERDQQGKWKAVAPAGADANTGAIESILSEMTILSASRFEGSGAKNLAAFGLEPARVSITFGLAGESGISKSLLIGSVSEDLGVYAMIRGQDAVFVLEREIAELLARGLTR